MSFLRAVRAELGKAATLPGVWVGAVVAVVGLVGITAMNSASSEGLGVGAQVGSALAEALVAAPIGTVGAIVLGVVVMSSEYTANSTDAGGGRQIAATLAAMPNRGAVMLAKVVAVLVLVGVLAVLALGAALVVAAAIRGGGIGQPVEVLRGVGGAFAYWAMSGLMALAITTLTRSGIVPLLVLVVNSSLVSVSFLLTMVTSAARYLPDLAGTSLLGMDPDLIAFDDPLPLPAGALVMATWTVVLLAIASVVFVRRDA